MRQEGRARGRVKLAGLLTIASVAWLAPQSVQAQTQAPVELNIASQDLASAIRQVGRRTRAEIIFSPSIVGSRRAPALVGSFTTEQALARLLEGTGLAARRTAQGGYVIERRQISDAAASVHAAEFTDDSEIIVTATKRAEPVRKISGSVSAQTGEQLEKLGAQGLADYLTRTPGVVFNAGRPGDGSIAIRGVSTTTGRDQGQATTGIFINDVPLTDPSISIGTPDIDTFDVDNVTVLRGPQGTLFGSASLGGAVNYQASRPDLARWAGRAQVGLHSIEHGGIGVAGKVMLNAPVIEDVLAVRGVFVYREDAGFIDNIGIGKRDSNRTVTTGGRFLASWKPGPDTTIAYMYLDQRQKTGDTGFQQPTLAGELRKTTVVPERSDFRTLIHNLRFDQDLGFATLTATATYHRKKMNSREDYSAALSPFLFDLTPITSIAPGKNDGQTYEVRLASAPGGAFDYVVGAMHDDTDTRLGQLIYATGLQGVVDGLLGPGKGAEIVPRDRLADVVVTGRARESALFGEATYHLNDQLKVTLGGRLFEQELKLHSLLTDLFLFLDTGNLVEEKTGTQKSSGFNPKGSITWTPRPGLMIYALASKGFRFGGPNIIPALPGSNVPRQFDSDSLWNYELGMRADLFDRKLLLDVTGFYVDWSNIQLRLTTANGLNYADNAGKARSYGLEASATLRPADGLNLTSNLTYLNAKLSEPFDPNPSAPGPVVPAKTTLPGASKWQVSNTVAYERNAGAMDWSVVFSHRYISRAPGALVASSAIAGAPQGGYNLFDIRTGVRNDRIGITLFLDNISDSRGVTSGFANPLQQYVVRPRTFGVTVDYRI
ncbi:TonB-dependent receptor precursor [Sphingopyxis sp. LC81]|uniref:TonB-dependent receptor domain-containing protein n=1 Tax=Sphingopyxis sp. LC81 TaxID=1502850 RepID=UPI00050F5C17|nr:TonB-dependent receptor [Sphingopyxis sp. LC81]KGB53963.1 TonB-dependent receptor precursor [Sphingopyxis sp. LC81]